MALLFCLWIVTTIAVVCIWCSAGLTFQDSKLRGFVIKTFKSTDWLHCLEECNNNDDCVSYNYNRLGSDCELNKFGPKIRCHANGDEVMATNKYEDHLLAFHGWIHHTLDPSKYVKNTERSRFSSMEGSEKPTLGSPYRTKILRSISRFYPNFSIPENKN